MARQDRLRAALSAIYRAADVDGADVAFAVRQLAEAALESPP